MEDASALAFAVGFYDAVGAGSDYESSFLHGRNAIELDGLPGHNLPVLLRDTVVPDGASAAPANGSRAGGKDTGENAVISRVFWRS